MRLYQGTAANSSSARHALADAFLLFAAVADYAAGAPAEQGERVASLAVALAEFAERDEAERMALAYAARLRNIGALGNPALQKGAEMPPRAAAMQLSDVPADGARLCERFGALPALTADLVRWQSEAWDGTGFPDQLRWHGVPKAAQLLSIAKKYVEMADPEEAFATILAHGGREFGPEMTRAFVMWYHTNAGEIENRPFPADALNETRTHVSEVLQILGERIDAHNGTQGRWERVGGYAERVAETLQLPAEDRNDLALAALFFGTGELRAHSLESVQFDPLARLGIRLRAEHAAYAAAILPAFPTFAGIARVIGARAEWYDGSGLPGHLFHEKIPVPTQVLAIAIAYDALEEAYGAHIGKHRQPPLERLDGAAGTQFDPRVVRALQQAIRGARA